jgi:uridine kinase
MIILLAGGSCSGKSTFAKKFKKATTVSIDNFYIGKDNLPPNVNFDMPESVDLDEVYKTVLNLKKGQTVKIPKYSMKECKRIGEITINPKPIILVEGIFALHHPKLRKIADLKIFIDVPTEERVKRRMIRDIEKGRSALETLEYSKVVEKMHNIYVEPQKKFADLII